MYFGSQLLMRVGLRLPGWLVTPVTARQAYSSIQYAVSPASGERVWKARLYDGWGLTDLTNDRKHDRKTGHAKEQGR